jgi:DNA-directed RNA polymerase specialized sigma24 family protein
MLTAVANEFWKLVKLGGWAGVIRERKCESVAALQGGDWSKKSDEELAAALTGADPADVDHAMTLPQERYRGRLAAYMRAKVPEDWVEDVIQETWLGFYRSVQRDRTIGKVSALLNRIAQRRRVDAIRKLTTERQIELDLDPFDIAYEDQTQGFAVERSIEEKLQQEAEAFRAGHLLKSFLGCPLWTRSCQIASACSGSCANSTITPPRQ